MSSFMSKFGRKSRNDYKELYEIELHNRKMYEEKYKETRKENVNLQKETGLADLRKKMMELADQVEALKPLKEENAKLKLELEDTKGFLEQEKAAKKVLLERNKKALEYLEKEVNEYIHISKIEYAITTLKGE